MLGLLLTVDLLVSFIFAVHSKKIVTVYMLVSWLSMQRPALIPLGKLQLHLKSHTHFHYFTF